MGAKKGISQKPFVKAGKVLLCFAIIFVIGVSGGGCQAKPGNLDQLTVAAESLSGLLVTITGYM